MGKHHIKPGLPGDILEHHGVKGMRWGVVKKDEPAGPLAPAKKEDVSGQNAAAKKEHSGLTPNQKKAILAAGVGVVAIGGFVAYKHYAGGSAPTPHVGELTDWGNPIPKHPDMSALKTQRLSDKPLGELGHKNSFFLYRKEGLTLDTSKGYADWLPKDGFSNEHVKARHDTLIRSLEDMREKYPAIRNMNIEVVPTSHGFHHSEHGTHTEMASALQLGAGEARLYYNDMLGALDSTPELRKWTVGFDHPDSLGAHEMGHILAGAHGELFSTQAREQVKESLRKTFSDHHAVDDVRYAEEKYHKALFKKHGMTYEELSKLSGYAATTPIEALAELSGTYHVPELRAKMDPELAKKAKAMFDEMGGLS